MQYRREIDGLRALAVIPVILFHAGFQTFSGGYVGVDVFFVISGYLITTIICAEADKGRFSIIKFYERRARRILPALFLVMFACLAFAWAWLLPSYMKSFSESLAAVSIFSSNILFFIESGYFDGANEVKPLIHTWSLGVEEQFYLFFPLFIMLMWRFGKRALLAILLLGFLISLALAVRFNHSLPAASFFLLPSRGWELLIGAFAAFYFLSGGRLKPGRFIDEAGAALGVLLIVYAIIAFDKNTPFPSLFTLIPTVGTLLIILFASQETAIGRLLGAKMFVGIGLISYSAYLWHQPLFAFARFELGDEIRTYVFIILIIVTFGLAFISWKFVERPFRNPLLFTRKQIFVYGASASTFFIVFGLTVAQLNGLPQRYPPEQRALLTLGDRGWKQTLVAYGLRTCFIDYDQNYDTLLDNKCVSAEQTSKRAVVLGDSEAAHWMTGVRAEFSRLGFNVEQWTAVNCGAVAYRNNDNRCNNFYAAFMRDVAPLLNSNDFVIVSSRWILTLQNTGEYEFLQGFRDLIAKLKTSGVNIFVIGNTPEYYMPPHHLMVMENIPLGGKVYLKSKDFRQVNNIIRREADTLGYIFFDPSRVLCADDEELSCLVSEDGIFYYFDHEHLSTEGSSLLAKRMVTQLRPSRNEAALRTPAYSD
jgi:peptidoglycan/LPS O-acetylase OafA/YrhL